MRKVTRYPVEGHNSLWHIYRTVSPWKGVRNFIFFIQIARYCPVLPLKNWIYRRVLGMKVGKHTAFGLMAMVDVFFQRKSLSERTLLSAITPRSWPMNTSSRSTGWVKSLSARM
ncbi:hypothetical protein ACFSQ7_51440 [Paenibacillus rhizoplanae]